MSVFRGYLLKNPITGANANSFLLAEGYDSTPNQREDIKAFRDDNTRDLFRVTAKGKKSAIAFSVIPMNLAEKMAMQEFFNSCMVDIDERKVQLEFWDDEKNEYRTKYFYMPDIRYPIAYIETNNIQYKSFEIKLVEY